MKLKKTKHYKSYLMGAERMNLLANKIQEAKTHSGKKKIDKLTMIVGEF